MKKQNSSTTSTNVSTNNNKEGTVMTSTDMTSTDTYLTGYKVAQVVNEMLTSRKLKNIPPQMCYNYIKKGYIPSVTVNGQQLVTFEAAAAWGEGYVQKKMNQSS